MNTCGGHEVSIQHGISLFIAPKYLCFTNYSLQLHLTCSASNVALRVGLGLYFGDVVTESEKINMGNKTDKLVSLPIN